MYARILLQKKGRKWRRDYGKRNKKKKKKKKKKEKFTSECRRRRMDSPTEGKKSRAVKKEYFASIPRQFRGEGAVRKLSLTVQSVSTLPRGGEKVGEGSAKKTGPTGALKKVTSQRQGAASPPAASLRKVGREFIE